MAIAVGLRPAAREDAAALAELERGAFARPNWSPETFLRYDCTVAEADGRVVGFLVSREVYPGSDVERPEREILNLAVAPEWQRRGIARQLLQGELSRHALVLLEVRESNSPARALYEAMGFVEILRRKNYYQEPLETAIVMQSK